MRFTKSSTLVAVAAVSVLGLAGCSGGAENGQGESAQGESVPQANVYEFQTNGAEPGPAMTVKVPDELREAAGADAEGLLVNAYQMKAHELDSAEYCAADLTVDYADGAIDKLAQESTGTDTVLVFDDGEIEALHDDLVSDPVATLRTLEPELTEVVGEEDAAYFRDEAEAGNAGGLIDMLSDLTKEVEEVTPAESNLLNELTGDRGELIGEFDPAAPEDGVYVSDDYSTITIVGDCAASPFDPDSATSIEFPVAGEDGDFSSFADADVAVMTDGTVSVVGGEVDDYMRDSNDNWIAS